MFLISRQWIFIVFLWRINRLSHLDQNKGEEWKVRLVGAVRQEFGQDTFA